MSNLNTNSSGCMNTEMEVGCSESASVPVTEESCGNVDQRRSSFFLKVGFNEKPDNDTSQCEKEQPRYLTAKYPKHQMGLVRKRINVEDWIDEELKKLYDISDTDLTTYEAMIDLEELLNLDTDTKREAYIRNQISDVQKPESQIKTFVDELLAKANTL